MVPTLTVFIEVNVCCRGSSVKYNRFQKWFVPSGQKFTSNVRLNSEARNDMLEIRSVSQLIRLFLPHRKSLIFANACVRASSAMNILID